MSKIVVTGIGVISSIGNTVDENRMSLMNAVCGISKISETFPSRFAGVLPFGEIKISTEAFKEKLRAYEHGITRNSLLALHAFEEAINDGKLTAEQIQSFDTAFIGASTIGGICLTDQLYKDANEATEGSEFLSSYDCASVNMYLQQRYKIRGIVNTINTACSSSANAIMFGARLIKNGRAKRAIVGGVDCIAKFTLNGFNSLFILSPDTCAPFDAARKGLNLGEGAAYLILEKEEDCIGKRLYATLTGYANANDAFHPSSLSENGDGPYLAMSGALKSANLSPADIDFINAHGTATENNDEVESKAMIRLFEKPPAFASTKSNTGHTLGAAGAVEAVYSILSIANQE
ncbi:MAG: beta-ketoacyl-[acyl-carrier-protein] synthase family protein, partial [Ferruginibacter sp.]